MPWDNSLNPARGRDFEALSMTALTKHFAMPFVANHAVAIGDPPKLHRFDLVALQDGVPKIACECKCYAWTESGNVPSAKMAFMNEAVLYLGLLPSSVAGFIVVPVARHPKRRETLAEYYFRTYLHLLRHVAVVEIDQMSGELHVHQRRGDGADQ